MFGANPSIVEPSSFVPRDAGRFQREPRTARPMPAHPDRTALCTLRIARWARDEGVRAGDRVALLTRDAGLAESLRAGLAGIGAGLDRVDADLRGAALAEGVAGAGLAIVDTALADAYAGVMGRLDAYPAVWWNGQDADFARLDLALAEYDARPADVARG